MATLLELAASIVESHASTSPMSTDDLLHEIQKVYVSLKALEGGKEIVVAPKEEKMPAISVKDSFKKNEVICMVCSKGGFKTLARHLKQAHGMKPGEYKKQFGIPSKQPLAAKSFSEYRRKMALDRGLADVLAKARDTRTANIKAKKATPVKPGKTVKASKSETISK